MPKRYEEIKTKMRRGGLSDKAAKTAAAKIYESTKKPNEPHIQTVAAREKKRKKS